MATTQMEGRGSSTKNASGGGGFSLEMKMLVPVLLLLAVLSLFPFFYIIWMSLNTVSLIHGISFDFAGLANWTRMFTDVIVGAGGSALAAVILMDVWEWTPLIVLIVLAGLASVNQYVIEAAKVDGASYLERLRYIVAPSIAGVVIVALLVRSMDAIRYFDIITVTTNGGPGNTTKIIPIRLYETAFRFFDLGYAESR